MVDKLHEINRFSADLDQCIKCGFCAFWCPVYQEEKLEASVARGKNVLIRKVRDGELDLSSELSVRINKCTLCMTCTENCPAKTKIPPVIIAARADIARARGIKFPYSFVYRQLLPRRTMFGNIVKIVSLVQPLIMPKSTGTTRHLPLFLSALGKGRNIPKVASKFLRQQVPIINKPPEGVKQVMRIGYFTGCMTDFVFPETGKKIINFLNRNGVEVVLPREQGCCGAPIYMGAGDFETGRRIADSNAAAFKDLDYVITDCGSCGSAIKDYAKFLADTTERNKTYNELGNKVKDISEFLVDILKLPASAYKVASEFNGKKVTYHDSCHLNRHMGVKNQPRQILKSLKGIEYVEMSNADRCCGMAGAFSIHFYELSQKIAAKKIDGIVSTGCDVVTTGCPGCEIQLMDSTIKNKLPVKVAHVMDLIE